MINESVIALYTIKTVARSEEKCAAEKYCKSTIQLNENGRFVV